MTGWPSFPLGELFEIARGGSPRPIDDYITEDTDGINWISISDASDSSKFISSTKRKIKPSGVARSREVKSGDFLLTNSMSFGRPYIMRTSGCIHDGWLLMRPTRPDIDSDYFYHLLGSDAVYQEFSKLASGVTVKNLNIDLVSGVRVPLPPLEEQRRIAAILDEADALRAKRRVALAQLDEMAASLYWEMHRKVRRQETSNRASLNDLADILVGFPFQSASYSNGIDDIRLCRGANVLPGRIDWQNEARWPADQSERFSEYSLTSGDIVIAMDRPWISDGFKIALITNSDLPAFLVQRVARIRAKKFTDIHYLYYLMMSQEFQLHCRPTETTVPHISPNEIRSFRFLCWPNDLRVEFAHAISEINLIRADAKHAVAKADSLFASLQTRAFRGEL